MITTSIGSFVQGDTLVGMMLPAVRRWRWWRLGINETPRMLVRRFEYTLRRAEFVSPTSIIVR